MVKRTDRIGERFETNEGYEIIIVEYNKADDLWVEFQDEYKARIHTSYNVCKKGEIKNPYHPCMCNIASLGLMPDGSKPKTTDNGKHTREYDLWKAMIQRCYSDKFHERCPTYKDATVCDRWLTFANFLEDLPSIEGYQFWFKHPNEGVSLDKDIKGNGSKVYCLDNCCFVTRSDNLKEVRKRCNYNSSIKIQGVNIKTGEYTKIFNSIKEASREMGLHSSNICDCFNGRQNTCGGYKWFKIKEEF